MTALSVPHPFLKQKRQARNPQPLKGSENKMVIVASHHRDKTAILGHSNYVPRHPWEKQDYIQWGESLSGGPAFVEVFLSNGIMIRGEAKTISEAEDIAFSKALKRRHCEHHWRRKFTNPAGNPTGICLKCGATSTHAYKTLTKLGGFRDPLNYHDILWILNTGLRPYDAQKNDTSKSRRMASLKARQMGIHLPDIPETKANNAEFCSEIPDSYRVLVRDALITAFCQGKIELGDTYNKMLTSFFYDGRRGDAWVWRKKERRSALRIPVPTETPNASVGRDDVGLFVSYNHRIFRPEIDTLVRPTIRQDKLSIHDTTDGGLLHGDQVHVLFEPDENKIVINLPDGRNLHWSV
jgi:hypothetical protein